MNAHTILTRHLDSSLTLAEAAARLLRATQSRAGLDNLYLDDSTEGILRIGGSDLRGDMLFRPDRENAEGVVAHFRHGDRRVFQALVAATGDGWTVRRKQPASTEGLDLLEFVQEGHRLGHCKRVRFADAAVADAVTCVFDELDLLIRFLVELEVHGEEAPPAEEAGEPSLEAVRRSLAGTSWVIRHEGRRVALRRQRVLEGRRNDLNLVIRYDRLPGEGGYLIGGLEDRQAA